MYGAIVAGIINRKCLRKAAESCNLAKQCGTGIARTENDFLRIIREKNTGQDLECLKGKALFDRVKELSFSMLRSRDAVPHPRIIHPLRGVELSSLIRFQHRI